MKCSAVKLCVEERTWDEEREEREICLQNKWGGHVQHRFVQTQTPIKELVLQTSINQDYAKKNTSDCESLLHLIHVQ